MQTTLRITQIGNSVGVILPKEILAKLKVEKGDMLFVTETPNGVSLHTDDAKFAAQMSAARDIMKQRRQVLSVLAK